MAAFVDETGKEITFKAWEGKMINSTVSHDTIKIDGKNVTLWSRYSGLGDTRYKITIHCDDPELASHKKFHGFMQYADDAATVAKEHARLKALVEASNSADLEKIPVGDQAKTRVVRKSLEEVEKEKAAEELVAVEK